MSMLFPSLSSIQVGMMMSSRSYCTTSCVFVCCCFPGVEYVKVVLVSGRMVGAVLVGDTDLEVRGRAGGGCVMCEGVVNSTYCQ